MKGIRWRATCGLLILTQLCLIGLGAAQVDGPPAVESSVPGQFFEPILEPIRHDVLETLRTSVSSYMTRVAEEGQRPILVFEFRPGGPGSDQTSFGAASDLADYLSRELPGARKTVAFVPEPLAGYALLAVLACDEIVIGPDASLGPIVPEGQAAGERERAVVRELARNKGRDEDLLLGLLDPTLDLREVRTADGVIRFVLKENLQALSAKQQVLEDRPAWEFQPGVLTPERARRTIARLETSQRSEIARVYGLPSTAIDPTLAAPPIAELISVTGRVTPLSESFLVRQIARAQASGVNLLLFEINSEGGTFQEANRVAEAIEKLEGIKTIAYISDRALGVSSLIPLACDDIVMRSGSRMGDIRLQITGTGGETEAIDERMRLVLADRAESLAESKGRPGAVARALVDPDAVIHRARDSQTGAVVFVLDSTVLEQPGRYEILETPKSAPGVVLELTDATAPRLQMADRVVRDLDDVLRVYGVTASTLRQARRSWVDSVVDTLNQPWVKGVLLFLGFFMLALELKLPGIGLPAITSGLAFLLYFWSSYLGGTADQLEVLLFLGGVLCLGLELLVLPGFGVFGLSGGLLVLISIVMASHTFVWPTHSYEYRQLSWTLARILGALGGMVGAIMLLGRFIPSVPFLNRLILKPETARTHGIDPLRKPSLDEPAPLSFLLGEVGRATTVLRPSGKARFGEMLVDVTADGFFIEANQPVEVVEVRGAVVIVKQAHA